MSKDTIIYGIPLKHFWSIMDVLEDEYDWGGDDIFTELDEDDCCLGLRAYRLIFPSMGKSCRTGDFWCGDEIKDGVTAEYEENEEDPSKFNMFYTGMFHVPSGNDDTVFHIDLAGKLDPEEFKKAVDEAIAEEEARNA